VDWSLIAEEDDVRAVMFLEEAIEVFGQGREGLAKALGRMSPPQENIAGAEVEAVDGIAATSDPVRQPSEKGAGDTLEE
jgi:hypothetical protein